MNNNRNKIIGFMVSLAMLFSCFIGVDFSYATDETIPEINSLEIKSADSIDAQGSLKIEVDIVEEGTGVTTLSLSFENADGHKVNLNWYSVANKLFTGKHTLSIPINGQFRNGEYTLFNIHICDRDANQTNFEGEDLARICPQRTIQVSNSTLDAIPPIINSLTIRNANSIDAQGKMVVDADITEDGAGVYILSLYFKNERGHTVYYDVVSGNQKILTGTHSFSIPIENKLANGEYKLYYIAILDNDFNQTDYWEEDLVREGLQRTVNVVNSTTDITAPAISSIQFENHSINTPNVLTAVIDLTEEESGVWNIDLSLKNAAGHTVNLGWTSADDADAVKTGRHTIKIPISPFVPDGDYSLTFAAINDRYNNQSDYWTEDIPSLTENATISINSSFDISYYGSLGNIPGALSAINNLNPGEVAVLDCRDQKAAPKEIFDAIEGTDKTVVFEDEDVQWVFKGTDIISARCKTIDLTTEFSVNRADSLGFPDEENNEVLVVWFRDNGLLPGEADIRINNDYITTKYMAENYQIKLSYISNGVPEVEAEKVEIEDDEAAVLEIDHNSRFVISETAPRRLPITGASLKTSAFTYSGKNIAPAVSVKASNKTLRSSNYSLSYKNNKNVGKATVTIKGSGIYCGTITKTFKINPKGTSISSIKPAKKAMTVKWKKQSAGMSKSRITGYQIRYSKYSSMKKAKTTSVKGYKYTSKKIKKLKKGKYYVQIRTYMKTGGKTYYSKWSKTKSVKVK